MKTGEKWPYVNKIIIKYQVIFYTDFKQRRLKVKSEELWVV